jgi:hypothetical protein
MKLTTSPEYVNISSDVNCKTIRWTEKLSQELVEFIRNQNQLENLELHLGENFFDFDLAIQKV